MACLETTRTEAAPSQSSDQSKSLKLIDTPGIAAGSPHTPTTFTSCHFTSSEMSLLGPQPLKAVARAVPASSRPLNQCQRRSISQTSRVQPSRPSLATRKEKHRAFLIRVRHDTYQLAASGELTCSPEIPCLVIRLRNRRSVQDARRRQERFCRRNQEGVLRAREEVPSRHEQRGNSQGSIRGCAVRLRGSV
jgi:hypothetical protein